MRIAGGVLVCVLLVATPALAQRRGYFDDFVGWSADGSFFVMTTAGTDGLNVPVLCLSRRGVASPSWPKNVPAPADDDADGCTDRWDMMFPDERNDPQTFVSNATKFTVATKQSVRGPGGETVSVKRAAGEIIEI